MKKNLQKIASVLLMCSMVAGGVGCSSSGDTAINTISDTTGTQTSTSSTNNNQESLSEREAIAASMKDTTINIRSMNEFTNIDKVVERYKELVKDDPILSKITPECTYVTGGDYKDKLAMAMVAQEDYDLMFCGSWHGLDGYIAPGLFADLTSYSNNDAFPGLPAGFTADYTTPAKSFIKNDEGQYEENFDIILIAEFYEDTSRSSFTQDL